MLVVLDGRGALLRSYRFDWSRASGRVASWPAWLRPLGLAARNLRTLFRYVAGLFGCVETAPDEAFHRREVFRSLSLGVGYVHYADVPGDAAEFGCMSGISASILARGLAEFGRGFEPKKLHLYDSFQGLPEATAEEDRGSPHVQAGVWGRGVCKDLSAEELRQVCRAHLPADRVLVYEGWFKDTVSGIPKGTVFSLVHIDCDLYRSTMDVLEALFSRGLLAQGAAVFFDDWNANRAGPQFGERKAWADCVRKFSIDFSDWGSYSWGGQRFIIHRYQNPTV